MSAAFVPTHLTPRSGMDSWPRPDAQVSRGPRINGDLEVQVVERQGDWANVVFTNGWAAWVDGRQLVAKGAGPPRAVGPPAAAPTGASAGAGGRASGSFDLASVMNDRPKAFALGGAALVAISTILPWIRGGGSTNAFDVPISFLFDYKTTSTGGLKTGLLLLAVVGLAVAAVLKGLDKRVQLGAGVAGIVIPALFVLQLQRLVSAAGTSSLTDLVGFGVFPAIAGGALIAFAPQLAGAGRGRP